MNNQELKNIVLNFLNNSKRPWLSEMNLQIDLCIHLKNNGVSIVIPEYPVQLKSKDKVDYIDIFCSFDNTNYAIELKYKTAKLSGISSEFQNSSFTLKEHSAQNLTRAAFIHDIEKLENVIKDNNFKIHHGIFIGITNDETIWNKASKNTVSDLELRFKDENDKIREITWYLLSGKISKTYSAYKGGIDLKGKYKFDYDWTKTFDDLKGKNKFIGTYVEIFKKDILEENE